SGASARAGAAGGRRTPGGGGAETPGLDHQGRGRPVGDGPHGVLPADRGALGDPRRRARDRGGTAGRGPRYSAEAAPVAGGSQRRGSGPGGRGRARRFGGRRPAPSRLHATRRRSRASSGGSAAGSSAAAHRPA